MQVTIDVPSVTCGRCGATAASPVRSLTPAQAAMPGAVADSQGQHWRAQYGDRPAGWTTAPVAGKLLCETCSEAWDRAKEAFMTLPVVTAELAPTHHRHVRPEQRKHEAPLPQTVPNSTVRIAAAPALMRVVSSAAPPSPIPANAGGQRVTARANVEPVTPSVNQPIPVVAAPHSTSTPNVEAQRPSMERQGITPVLQKTISQGPSLVPEQATKVSSPILPPEKRSA